MTPEYFDDDRLADDREYAEELYQAFREQMFDDDGNVLSEGEEE